ncbi:hypothetical protein [Okeania sp. SIO2C2]|uniref:hypothetical protein n=1 Tax=Okeania sp. SIO2C2 TaxID=2607787 RepID=UPI00257A8421|nr:hypothetical protein [Okeania sp. SIO2C2]
MVRVGAKYQNPEVRSNGNYKRGSQKNRPLIFWLTLAQNALLFERLELKTKVFQT